MKEIPDRGSASANTEESFTPYHSDDYQSLCCHLRTLSSEDCHPALFECRTEIIAQLNRAARNPDAEMNRQLLAGVRFLLYCPPRK